MAWTKKTKSSAATFTKVTKNSPTNDYLLKEDTFYLLLETGDKIVIRRSGVDWTKVTKH